MKKQCQTVSSALLWLPLATFYETFRSTENLWINIGIILMLFTGIQYGGTLVMAFGVMLGAGFLIIFEYLFLKMDIKNFRRFAKISGVQSSACKVRKTIFNLQSLPVVFIMLQAIGSKGQMLVERTLGIGLPQGSIASLNYAFRLYAFPFALSYDIVRFFHGFS